MPAIGSAGETPRSFAAMGGVLTAGWLKSSDVVVCFAPDLGRSGCDWAVPECGHSIGKGPRPFNASCQPSDRSQLRGAVHLHASLISPSAALRINIIDFFRA